MVVTEVSELLGKLKHDAELGLCPRYYFAMDGYVNLDDVLTVSHRIGCIYATIGGVYIEKEEILESYLSSLVTKGYQIVSLHDLRGYSFG